MTSNCIASVSIGCLFCFQRCDVEKIRVAFTFLPPQPSYSVVDAKGTAVSPQSDDRGKLVYLVEALQSFGFYQTASDHAEVAFVQRSDGHRCPMVWMRPSGSSSASQPPANQQRLVLLHCHGNATDIGMMMGPYFEMSEQLGIEVAGVEYSGYGMSTGKPGTARTLGDVEAAYQHLIAQGVPPERIVAYGQSVGSGPAAYIASQHKIGGLILHSPLMSGIKVIDPQPDKCCRPSCVFGICDFYPTDTRLKKAQCPTFVIHGQMDDIVPFYHGFRLSEMTPEQHRWPGYFPAKAGHNDIVESNVIGYFRELQQFLGAVASGAGMTIIQEKPPQQMMMQPGGMVLGASEVDKLRGPDDGGAIALSYNEPVVGPQDGMYNSLRREEPKAVQPQPVPIGSKV